jgi:hypothetical protein
MDKHKNEEGTLKFPKGSLYDGVFEVYPYQMDPEDVQHVVKELVEYADKAGIQLDVPQKKPKVAIEMTNDELIETIRVACSELSARGNRFMIESRLAEYFPKPKPAVVRIDLIESEMALVESGRHITAIKAYRERTGAGLRDAKDQCDAYRDAWNAAGKPIGGIPRPLPNDRLDVAQTPYPSLTKDRW